MRWLVVFMLSVLMLIGPHAGQPAHADQATAAPAFHIEFQPPRGDDPGRVIVSGLGPKHIKTLREFAQRDGQWSHVLTVRVGSPRADADVPAVSGRYRMEDGQIVYTPRYPFTKGLSYQVTFNPAAAGIDSLEKLTSLFRLPDAARSPTAHVTNVRPSADRLPQNLLKLYVHFSAPMRRGDVYQYIRLLDEKGQAVELPFLELDTELWDPSGTRLTLLFDPGRVKRGVKPREDLGPALVAGRRYTLRIDENWPDAEGARLVRDFRKTFEVTPPDRRSPDPSRWKLTVPPAAGREPLVVRFAEPLDGALVERLLRVADSQGGLVPGRGELSRYETQWAFTPEKPWTAAVYRILAETVIEDLAGNSIARPFEVELTGESPAVQAPDTVEIPFHVQPAKAAGGSP